MSQEFMKTELQPPFPWHSMLTDTCKSHPAMAWRSKSVRGKGKMEKGRQKGSDGKRGREEEQEKGKTGAG